MGKQMAEIDSWSTSALLNQFVGGKFIGEGMDRADTNDAMRAIMAGVKEYSLLNSDSFKSALDFIANPGTASTDTIGLQQLLDLRGKLFIPKPTGGQYLLNAPLKIHSDTELVIEPGTIIRQSSGIYDNLIKNACWYDYATNGVSVAGNIFWLSGLGDEGKWKCKMGGLSGLSLVVGDYVWIEGVDQMAFNGVFPVIELDGADVIVKLDRVPAANPTGASAKARKADVNIKISGGLWDYNKTQNNPDDVAASLDYSRHATVFAGIHDFTFERAEFKDTSKFCICMAAADTYLLERISGYALFSDVVKIYGPSFRGRVKTVRGYPGDDFISLHNFEPAEFIDYLISKGDIRDIIIEDVALTQAISGAGVMTSIYPQGTDSRIENIILRDYSGSTQGGGIQIVDSEGGNAVQEIKIQNYNVKAQRPFRLVAQGTGLTTIKDISIEIGPQCRAITGAMLVSVEAGVTVENLTISGRLDANPSIGSGALVDFTGDVVHFTCKDLKYISTTANLFTVPAGTKTMKMATFINCQLECAAEMFAASSATFSQTPVFNVHGGRLKGTKLFEFGSAVTIGTFGVRLEPTQYVANAIGASAEIDLNSQGSDLISGEWAVGSASGKINPRSFEVVIGIENTYVKRKTGNMATTISATGTIPASSPAICDNTATTGSWSCIVNGAITKY